MSILFEAPWFVRGDLRQRAHQIASVLTRHGLGWMSVRTGLGGLEPSSRIPGMHGAGSTRARQALHLRLAFEELGATFIKLGQAASTRPDILPAEFAEELAKLQDAAPPVPLADVLGVIKDELHQSPDVLFAEFEPEPIASASIGQVHRGRLRDGDEIVVKVQRPGVAAQIDKDLLILGGMAGWADAHTTFGRTYQLAALVDEFDHTIHGEVDYRAEARNMDRFRANFIDEPALTVPRVYWQYTTTRVLTMERVGGIKISDLDALDRAHINRRRVAENSVRMMLREAFEFGLFHADPHPGNFFVRPDGGIALVDYGMVGHLSKGLQDLLLEMGVALVGGDAERLTDDLYALGVAGDTSQRNALQREIEHLLARYATSSMKELAAAQLLNELLATAFRFRLHLPSEIVMLFRVIVLSEGLGVHLDPTFQLLPFAAPYFREFWQRRRSPEALAMQLGRSALDASDVTLQLPRQISRLLNQVERGAVQVNINPDSVKGLMEQMQHMVNRLALSVILAGTIMGLGLFTVAYPDVWQNIGRWIIVLAFLASLALGAALLWSIFRTGGD